MRSWVFGLVVVLVACASSRPDPAPLRAAIPPPANDAGHGRYALLAHDLDLDGVDDVYAMACEVRDALLYPSLPWVCSIVVVRGGLDHSEVLLSLTARLHRVPQALGVNAAGEPCTLINGKWMKWVKEQP